MIKDNFVLGFSLKEVLMMAVCGAFCFFIIQMYDKGMAYQMTVTLIIFMGALLTEVPTTQQRFFDILKKAFIYMLIQKTYIQDTRR